MEMDSQQRPMILGKIPKLPGKWALIIIPFILSCLMSGIISMINLLRTVGWNDDFVELWLHNWMLSWMFAFPIVLLLLPVVRRLTALFVDMKGPPSA